jgi:hypothetical protein
LAVRTIEQAERDLSQHFEAMRAAVSTANAHFWRTYADDMYRTSARSRANVLCDYIGDELGKLLLGKPKIAVTYSYGVASYAIDQEWLLRVHKMDEAGSVATNNTELCLALKDNDLAEATLLGVPPSATVVYLGYIENVANPLLPEVWLTCPDGDAPAWEILLGTAEPPAPITLPTPTPPETPRETVIVPKREDKRETE